jgi:tRNA pseudouridine55 synthase
VLVGRALKLSKHFLHADKKYVATVFFGAETETLDPEGAVIASSPPPPREEIIRVLPQFSGNIMQTPPLYSALHVNGRRAHEIARSGGSAELKARPVTIYSIELSAYEISADGKSAAAEIAVHCSSGTYIRALARDIALAAGSRAHLSALVRTDVAGFNLRDAVTITNAESEVTLRPIDDDVFKKLGMNID